jgi:cell shape-determining protein MreC
MLEDGRCDLCGSHLRCVCGQYTDIGSHKKIEELMEEVSRLQREEDFAQEQLERANIAEEEVERLEEENKRLKKQLQEYIDNQDRGMGYGVIGMGG